MTPRLHLATLLHDMQRLGAQPAVVEHRGVRRFSTTYAELSQGACCFAAELTSRGIQPGERVILWGENSAAWIACFFGCVLRGVLVVPLDAAGGTPFAERILAETQPRLVAGDPILLQSLPFAPQFSLEDLSQAMQSPGVSALSWQALVADGLKLDTPLQILFTSGTTGDPKGIVHTHGNLLASLTPIEQEIAKYRRFERFVHPLHLLHTLPLSHVFGQFMGLWIAPVLGMVVHYESRLEAGRLLSLLRRERISILAAVPRLLTLLRAELLASHPSLPRELLASANARIWQRWWRFRHIHRQLGYRFWAIVCGGATLPAELEEFWVTLGTALIQGYGMTETSALVTLNHPFKPARGTLGVPLPGRDLRLTLEGELLVRGDMVASSIWSQGALRSAPHTNRDPENPGWLATGDLATRDEQGRLYFLGRTGQRLVTASGLNVYLEDVEAALAVQPAIRSAVALGVHTTRGVEPGAVLLAADAHETGEAVALANSALAPHQRIVRWWLWPGLDLPRTATGKVRRSLVEAWAAEQLRIEALAALSEDCPPKAPTVGLDPLLQLIASATGKTEISDPGLQVSQDPTLESLGLDSLGRVQLQTALERALGRPLDDTAFTAARTLGNLRTLAIAHAPRPALIYTPPAPNDPLLTSALKIEPRDTIAQRPHFLFLRWPWSTPVQLLRTLFLEACVRPLVWLLAAPRVRHSAQTSPPAAPMLIIANHVSSYDVPLLLYALPAPLRRRVATAAAGEMLEDWRHACRNPLGPAIYWLLTLLFNVFPLPRSHAFRAAFAHAGEALDRGYSVLLFPEGTRSHGSGLQPFRAGIGLLAQQAAVPVLPLALTESHASDRWRLRPYQVTVRIGETLTIAPGEAPHAITARLERAVRQLLADHPSTSV